MKKIILINCECKIDKTVFIKPKTLDINNALLRCNIFLLLFSKIVFIIFSFQRDVFINLPEYLDGKQNGTDRLMCDGADDCTDKQNTALT